MSAMVKTLIDDVGGVAPAARVCGVHVSTVRRWLRGANPMPKAAYQALLARSTWGRQDRAVMTANERTTLLALVESQRREIGQLRAKLARIGQLTAGAANQARFTSGV